MPRLLASYNLALKRRPVLTPCVTGAVLFALGDVLAQQGVERKGLQHDLVRTTRLGFYGGAMFSPLALNWFKLLERIPIKNKHALAASKVAADQGIFAPFAVGMFFSVTTLLEGKGTKEVQEKLQNSYVPTLTKNWMLFVPFQAINMSVIPLQHRLLAVNIVSLFWNTYLSIVANQPAAQAPVSAQKVAEKAL